MQILIAPNAFKNSLAADKVADAIAEGLQQSNLSAVLHRFPVGDGGDGTAQLLIQHRKGKLISAEAHDALGREIISSFGLIDNGRTAVIEMANASGLRLLQSTELNPLDATSLGTGELMIHALNSGVNKIILCIGGSATVDGGVGILQALGFRFLNNKNEELNHVPGTLAQLNSIDFSAHDKRLDHCKIIVLCDVDNTLLGKQGAANVFGPQKGANPADVKKLESSLMQLSKIVFQQAGKDMSTVQHGGAAGGVAAGLWAFLDAELVNGIDYFLSITGFDEILEKADLVITGEGSIDIQTLNGKGPYGVAKKAKEKRKFVIGLAGKIQTGVPALSEYFDVLLPINNEPMDIESTLLNTKKNLVRTSQTLGNLIDLARRINI
ncbi:MAG TPA: glycerate kinase [Chitinophagaceae bacterium]